jgi:hypothetical protein
MNDVSTIEPITQLFDSPEYSHKRIPKAARRHIAMLKAMIERIKKILSLLLKAISNSSNI